MFNLFSDPFFDDQNRLMNLLTNTLDDDDDNKQVQKKEDDIRKSFFWTPRCDVHETKNNFVVQAELPGIPKENININIEDNVLTISGKMEVIHETSSDDKKDKPEDKPEDKKEDKQEDKKEDKKEDKQEDKQEDKKEDKPEDKKEDKKEDKQEDKPIYHRMERTYGSFKRSYALPENILIDGIKADSKDGVLTITIPKRPVEPKKTIAITIN